jgi:acetoin utilization protein AcuB
MKKISDIMTKSLVTVGREETIEVANQIMTEKRINHILVVSPDGTLLGIVTDRDTKKFISPFVGSGRETPQDKATLAIKVEKIMKQDMVKVGPDDPIKLCIEKMLTKAIHAVPVVEADSKRLKGIVTTTNIMKWVISDLLP